MFTFVSKKRLRKYQQGGDFSLILGNRKYRKKIVGITCSKKNDRGGAQVHAVLSALLFSHATGIPYFHTRFGKDLNAWEMGFNLGAGFAVRPEDVPIIDGMTIYDDYQDQPAIVEQPNFHRFGDRNPDRYLQILDRVRSNLNLPTRTYDGPVIAVHIRRGDVSQLQHVERFETNEIIAAKINYVQRRHPDARVRVFSEGNVSDFNGLPDNCEFELNADILETILGLASADCLITAKSSFSYIAALLSLGTVYYGPFWHKPLSKWRKLIVTE
ncbi:MAG: hypothetical protein P1V21_01170 [Rhizobiaceae bacterium]|nr:hypothetical protein [Rhizobiaceae bacterium]